MALLLTAVDIAGPGQWRWLLTDEASGAPLADHQVNLDLMSDEVARFANLYTYAWWRAAPDRRVADGARIVDEAGEWAGRVLLGARVVAAIAGATSAGPVTIRVAAGPPAGSVLLWPLELAHADGNPLAARGDVSFVYDVVANGAPGAKAAVAGSLQVLAVFSQPTETSVLALRRERYALTQLIRRLGRARARVTLQVAQYGVTRERLSEIAQDGDGWDVLHLSGHGASGAFLLEKPDGSPDLVSSIDLVKLLRPARSRAKLAVVSACESAADATAQTYRLLGLTEQAEALEAQAHEAASGGAASPAEASGLASALVRELGCTVIGMRYPVTDEFAIAFGDVLYEQLLSHRQPVDAAAGRAVADAAGTAASAARPAVSLATPGVFGARAVGLRLDVPRGRPEMDPAEQKMAYFAEEPQRFVGRAAAMARASAALAPDSGRTAVLLHGMAGAGKTACALELAYRHQGSFAALAFWQAPTRDDEWASALPDFAKRLDIQLADYGFTMAGHIGTVAALEAFLPRLRSVMASSGVLLVLDNMETLLTPQGAWRDPRWELLIKTLTAHDGESRLILTTRTPPAALVAGPRVVTLRVHALSLHESVTLARELPNLRALLHADPGPVRAIPEPDVDAAAEKDRQRVRRVLRVVQGHPKLMELADAAADNRNRLDTQLTAAEDAVAGEGLEAFFHDGTSTLDPDQFLGALTAWTVNTLGVLSPEARVMAEFVACLEEGDRRSDIIAINWADLWQRLDRPGDAPAPGPMLETLASAALVEPELIPVPGVTGKAGTAGQIGVAGEPGALPHQVDSPAVTAYRVHPGVAAAILAAARREVREAVDAELAAFWMSAAEHARDREGGEHSGLVVRAGLAAAPYLLRLGEWGIASAMLEAAISRDESPGTVQAALPTLRRVAAITGAHEDSIIVARALLNVDPAEAEGLLRGAIDAAVASGDYQQASAAAGDLVTMLRDSGRLGEALEVAEQKMRYTRRAGLGPWTQLADEGRRLQILRRMGDHARVLADVARLRAEMALLPSRPDTNESVSPWNVREVVFATGRSSALATGEWQLCLELNDEIVESKRRRGAGVYEITRFRLNDAAPLVELGRLAEAGRLLAECQRVFEDHADTTQLAMVLSNRARLEAAVGHELAAADLERTALRLRYAHPAVEGIAISHNNLASYLKGTGSDQASQRAHRLASALVFRLAGMLHNLAGTISILAVELREYGGSGRLTSTVAQVIEAAEQTEGVHLGALLAALQPDYKAVEAALAEILRLAAQADNP